MDYTEYYLALVQQGRDEFCRQAAPASLVRDQGLCLRVPSGPMRTLSMNQVDEHAFETTAEHALPPQRARIAAFEIYPLIKKAGSPFADMISVGRTSNNDVVLSDVSISRFHLYFRQQPEGWLVCDAGSRNGTVLDGRALQPNVKAPIPSGTELRLGDVTALFIVADEMFDWLAARVA